MTAPAKTILDVIVASAPTGAHWLLSGVDQAAAHAASVLGVCYLALGIAMRWREYRRGKKK
jgi:hypothetical protein